MVVPLPQETLNDVQIDAIYFDDGIRIMSESPTKKFLRKRIKNTQEIHQRRQQRLKEIEDDDFKQLLNQNIKKYEEQINTLKQELNQLPGNIEELLKLSNGAKNIYLFHCIIQKKNQFTLFSQITLTPTNPSVIGKEITIYILMKENITTNKLIMMIIL
ncbi:hypothetical protein ['Fragaria x ananassa' phyllody phytoplasma]|uniref:hypothetical protein n=1 Tax='Fragaria x ananassa' phyllody phytoplasma TaxID=2358428 RepID=UPI001CED30DC|nr:hypothetical protein ['Fragaria x ananassa' phyllody phytoplasma]